MDSVKKPKFIKARLGERKRHNEHKREGGLRDWVMKVFHPSVQAKGEGNSAAARRNSDSGNKVEAIQQGGNTDFLST